MRVKGIKILFTILCLILLQTGCGVSPVTDETETCAQIDCIAPDFSLTTLDGSTIKLSDLRGKSVFINFWSTNCRYCKYEMPNIQSMHDTYGSKGLIILGIATEDNETLVEAYIKQMKFSFTILLDGEGDVNRMYSMAGLPQSFFIDQEGVIRNIFIGEMSHDEMDERVQLILK